MLQVCRECYIRGIGSGFAVSAGKAVCLSLVLLLGVMAPRGSRRPLVLMHQAGAWGAACWPCLACCQLQYLTTGMPASYSWRWELAASHRDGRGIQNGGGDGCHTVGEELGSSQCRGCLYKCLVCCGPRQIPPPPVADPSSDSPNNKKVALKSAASVQLRKQKREPEFGRYE